MTTAMWKGAGDEVPSVVSTDVFFSAKVTGLAEW